MQATKGLNLQSLGSSVNFYNMLSLHQQATYFINLYEPTKYLNKVAVSIFSRAVY